MKMLTKKVPITIQCSTEKDKDIELKLIVAVTNGVTAGVNIEIFDSNENSVGTFGPDNKLKLLILLSLII